MPYGPGRNALGVDWFRDRAPIVPSAVAFTPAGLVVLDPAKGRAVLVDESGHVVQAWAPAPQNARHVVYDRVDNRIVLIADESQGALQVLNFDGTSSSYVVNGGPSKLTATARGVSMWRLRGERGMVPTALGEDFSVQPREDALPLPGGDKLTVRGRTRTGNTYEIASTDWRTAVHLRGTRRPRQVSAPLTRDLTVTDGALLFGVQAGSFHPFRGARPLYLLTVDSETGEVRRFTRVANCSSIDTTNRYVFFTADGGGHAYQWCLGRRHAELRRASG